MIKTIELVNFRNHQRIKIPFNNHFVYLYGENGTGKTSILEAIYFLATSKSFRTDEDIELIRIDQPFAKISLKNDRNEYEIVLSKKGKRLFIDKLEKKRVSEYIGGFNAVIFALEDLSLIKGTPAERRKFINLELIQLDREYLQYLSEYKKLLKQRNALLKTIGLNDDYTMLNILGNSLYETGIKIADKRELFLTRLSEKLQVVYKNFNDGTINLIYKPHVTKKEFYDWINHKQAIDILNKTTMAGPHKDDFLIKMNGFDAKHYASNGEQRLIVISLKMALLKQIQETNNKEIVLLLDDVLSELDEEKQNIVLNNIPKSEMVIITSATPCKINENIEIIMLKKEKKNE